MSIHPIQNNGTGIPSSTIALNGNKRKIKEEVRYKFRLQSAPPLSLTHFARTSTGLLNIVEDKWKHSGKYRPPKDPEYMSPKTRKPPPPIEVKTWMPAGQFKHIRPTSISPETRSPLPNQRLLNQPLPKWMPAGKIIHKPIPYFDPPALRWSLQLLMRSTPDMSLTRRETKSHLKTSEDVNTNYTSEVV
ncbi:unnamed protein product [Didymodactylos carnosus]|uniref:Uncharacterized protein n=1 Tax=Didymodactylos carnosus TaxID=1234261 RepID=A0A815D6K4_9BILA|nr:unnamed protein product [Didymodactylos carnosus]CAF4112232.1 unnamed protein product [Didymodactylos carnosus]